MPVLVDGAVMPHATQLPGELQPMVRRQAVELSHPRFASDSERIIQAINRAFEKAAEEAERERRGQIFISYRREESRRSAESLRDRLFRDYDRQQILMDIDVIAQDSDYVKAIEKTVAKCGVLIAVIGNNWLTAKDEHGNRRLDNPEDFVRLEIGTALERNIRVIPVLVDDALMPHSTDLPEDLKPLVRRNALRITETSFDGDCHRLAATIKLVLEKAAAEKKERLAAEQRQREDGKARRRSGWRLNSGRKSGWKLGSGRRIS